jgi:hypothetical protein
MKTKIKPKLFAFLLQENLHALSSLDEFEKSLQKWEEIHGIEFEEDEVIDLHCQFTISQRKSEGI